MCCSTRTVILRLAVAFGEDISRTLRRVAALVLSLAAVLVPAACGGGNGAALTQTGGTRTAGTLPARTTPTDTAATPTAPTTTEQGTTVTRTETQTQTETQTLTETAPSVTVQAPTTTTTTTTTTVTFTGTAAVSSTSSTPWGWIAAAIILIGAVAIGFVVWKRGRDAAKSWTRQMNDLTRRLLVSLDDVLAKGSVVTGQVEALAAEARTLERKAPDEPAHVAAGRLRESLDELVGVLESDRALRLASPPPSEEQLTYSAALVRERVQQLQLLLRPTLVTS